MGWAGAGMPQAGGDATGDPAIGFPDTAWAQKRSSHPTRTTPPDLRCLSRNGKRGAILLPQYQAKVVYGTLTPTTVQRSSPVVSDSA